MIKNTLNKILPAFIICILCMLLVSCANAAPAASTEAAEASEAPVDQTNEEATVRIIATSDLHGKMLPWEYATDTASDSGSLAQIASAIKEYRNENTILIDLGDLIQGNSADLFLDEDTHPMILGLNHIGYDVCTTGNHEYNYGMDVTEKFIRTQKAKVVISNVYDPDGKRLADPYTIINRGGIKVAVIGAVTPNILHWDKDELKGYRVTNPVDEINAAIREIGDNADVIIVAAHMGLDDELNEKYTGVRSIAELCPGVDLICAAHDHEAYAGTIDPDVPVTENEKAGSTISISDIHLHRDLKAWKVTDVASEIVNTESYAPDPEIITLLEPYHNRAREDLDVVIGRLDGGPLVDSADSADSKEAPYAVRKSSRLISFTHEVLKYYSKADVIAAPLLQIQANIQEGKIRKRDVANIYPYENSISVLKMTGKQLKAWMEWAVAYYNQTSSENPVVSIMESYPVYKLDIFSGVNYEINLHKPAGQRIENLTWPDGRPVKDDDEFTVATSDFRTNSALLQPGVIFDKGEGFPEVLMDDSGISSKGIFELIIDYIRNVKGGTINPVNLNNWRITGH